MRSVIKSTVFSAALYALPFVTLAQSGSCTGVADGTLHGVFCIISALVNGLIGLLITAAIVVFFWGLIKYIIDSGGEGKKSGLKIMLWGVVAIFVMVSIWGIVGILQRTFGVQNQSTIQIPHALQ